MASNDFSSNAKSEREENIEMLFEYIEILIVRRDDHNLRKSVDHR